MIFKFHTKMVSRIMIAQTGLSMTIKKHTFFFPQTTMKSLQMLQNILLQNNDTVFYMIIYIPLARPNHYHTPSIKCALFCYMISEVSFIKLFFTRSIYISRIQTSKVRKARIYVCKIPIARLCQITMLNGSQSIYLCYAFIIFFKF